MSELSNSNIQSKSESKISVSRIQEYVKGRKNIYVNPALAAYNQSSGAADKTAALLMKCIIAPLSNGGDDGDEFDTF